MIMQLQSWPTPEIFVSAAGPLQVSYAACREEFYFTLSGLDVDSIYQIQFSPDNENWYLLNYFALLEDQEKVSGEKVLRYNNDYNGNYWFRATRVVKRGLPLEQGFVVITTGVKPLEAEIPAPEIDIADISETAAPGIGEGMFIAANAFAIAGLIPPYSGVELPRSLPNDLYVRFSKRYSGRFPSTIGSNHVVTVTPANPEHETRYTRDNSDPTLETVEKTIAGVERNAAIWQNDFNGIIRARCFSGECKSPLALVAVDKSFNELPYLEYNQRGDTVTGYCDLERINPDTGLPQKSGYDCNDYFGGVTAFEETLKGNSNTFSPARSRTVISHFNLSTDDRTDYFGYVNHNVSVSCSLYESTTWYRKGPGRWDDMPRRYNYYVFTTGNAKNDLYDFPAAGLGVSATDVINHCNTGSSGGLTNHHYTPSVGEMVQSPLPLFNPNGYFWGQMILDYVNSPYVPIEPPIDEPQPEIYVNVEDWEAYYVDPVYFYDTMDGNTYDLAVDIFAGAWVITTYIENVAFDNFEAYSVGDVEDTIPLDEQVEGIDYPNFNKGDGFIAGWRFLSVETSLESFESYPVGTILFTGYNGGTGFSGDWVPMFELQGVEDWEAGYTDLQDLSTGGHPGNSAYGGDWVAVSY